MRTLVAFATIAATVACGSGSSRQRGPAPRPNILLVTIDTLRADRIGAGVAPNLDRLAASGLRFTAARSAVPLTLPSHTTILTGLLPPAHGVRENGVDALDERHPTVARLLKDAGYQTAAFIGADVLDRRFGLARGFDVYDDRIPRDPNATERLEAERRASVVVDHALAWLDAQTLEAQHSAPDVQHPSPSTQHPAPFFLWMHLYDPHAPYEPPPEFASRARTLQSRDRDGHTAELDARYDGEVAYADAEIARVFTRLRDRELLSRTLIVVAGDHGEGLGDHGERTHGMLVYDSTLRVPLLVVGPGIAPGARDDAVSLADIAPSILRAAGATPPAEMHGRDLVRLKADTTSAPVADTTSRAVRSVRLQADPVADVYAETRYPIVAGWNPLGALTDGRWKAIRAGRTTELYDLQADPQEAHDLAPAQAATAAAMAARIEAIAATGASAAKRAISSEAQDRLRSLGYVASSVQPAAPERAPNPAATIAAWNAFEDALSVLNAGENAVPALARLAADHPDAPIFQTTYARALKDAGRTADALEIYRRSAKRWPADATLLHDLAVTAREAAGSAHGGAAEALRDEADRTERAAVSVAPSSGIAHNGLGLIAADQGKPAEATREFEQATALDQNNASYWTNLGNARRATGDAAGADAAYRRALDVDARAADAANGLGVLLVEARRSAEAVTWFERALAASPDLVEAQLNLAIARQESGDKQGAVEAYRRVLAARGSHPREKDAAAKLLASLGAAR